MERRDQLEWEARAAKLAAVSAFLSAALVLASMVHRATSLPRAGDETRDYLLDLHENTSDFRIAAVIYAISILVAIPALVYLYRSSKFRRPELPKVALILAVAGPILFAVAQWVALSHQIDLADEFVRSGAQTEARADKLYEGSGGALLAVLRLTAPMALAFAFVMICLNAMRAGLVSRFMGILGMILGGLFVIPLVAGLPLQLLWFAALGVLFLGVWPGGRGPAWVTGDAIPWPTAADRYEADRQAQEEELEPEPVPVKANPRSRKRGKKGKKH